MSTYHITVTKAEYFPEGDYVKNYTVFTQVSTDDDVVRRVALAVNLDTKDEKTHQ